MALVRPGGLMPNPGGATPPYPPPNLGDPGGPLVHPPVGLPPLPRPGDWTPPTNQSGGVPTPMDHGWSIGATANTLAHPVLSLINGQNPHLTVYPNPNPAGTPTTIVPPPGPAGGGTQMGGGTLNWGPTPPAWWPPGLPWPPHQSFPGGNPAGPPIAGGGSQMGRFPAANGFLQWLMSHWQNGA